MLRYRKGEGFPLVNSSRVYGARDLLMAGQALGFIVLSLWLLHTMAPKDNSAINSSGTES